MSWDFEKTLGDVSASITDIFKTEYLMRQAKEAESLSTRSVNDILIPVAILGMIFLIIWKMK